MPTITVQLETPIRRTFRVEQVAGMFDLPIEERLSHGLMVEVPGHAEPWTIGAIVGPSGSGKTTLARAAFGSAVYEPRPWPEDRAIIDVLGEGRGAGVPPAMVLSGRRDACPTIKQLAQVLTAVGLGSVPTWLKPYRVLSTGERFRADLARAVLRVQGSGFRVQECGQESVEESLLVVDEFTSALDRVVARTTSAALARLLRKEGSKFRAQSSDEQNFFPLNPEPRTLNPIFRFVAVTGHTDILPWLAPDWVLELCDEAPRLTWPAWQRPELPLEIRRVPQSLWPKFAAHHYLAGGLAASATCYAAFVDNDSVAFCAVVAALGWRKTKRITRLVTLPQFQGLGIASRLASAAATMESQRGNRVTITASHPAIVGHCSASPAWRLIDVKKTGSTRQRFAGRSIRCSAGRAVASFEFVGGEREA